MINNIEIPVGWALILFITPFITSLGFAISSEYYAAQRKIYKAGIRVYREYKRFNKVLEFLEAGKIEEADDLIDSFAQNSDFRIFLKGHILAYKLKGDNIIDEKYAHQKMEELKETFSPYNVKFE